MSAEHVAEPSCDRCGMSPPNDGCARGACAASGAVLYREAVSAQKAWLRFVAAGSGCDSARRDELQDAARAAMDAYRASLTASGTYSHRKMYAVDRSARAEIRKEKAAKGNTKTGKRERRNVPSEPSVMSWSPRRTMKRVKFGGDITVECPACLEQAWMGHDRRVAQWRAARRWFRAHEKTHRWVGR